MLTNEPVFMLSWVTLGEFVVKMVQYLSAHICIQVDDDKLPCGPHQIFVESNPCKHLCGVTGPLGGLASIA
jgi:hypothetical protein